jgi:large subunit ribosomal protein L10
MASSGAFYFGGIHLPSQEKAEKVKQLKKWFEKADSLLVLHYKGLAVSEASELRGVLKDYDVDLRVLKNTLTRIALSGTSRESLIPFVDGPIAVVFVRGDAAGVARAVRRFSRGRGELFFQGGMIDQTVLTAEQVNRIASLPPREVLLAQLVGQAASPLSGLVGLCAGPVRKMLAVFEAIAEQKEKEPAAV